MKKPLNLKKILIVSFLIPVIAVISIGAYSLYQLNKIKIVKITQDNSKLGISTETTPGNTNTKIETPVITNILLFGDDRRNTDENGRSDSIMVLSLNDRDKKLKLVSIMRDTYVSVEGYGKTKLNHAFSYGGAELAIKTVNQNFLLDIKNYLKVDFSGLEKIVDAMGGVEIEIKAYELPAMKSVGVLKAGIFNLNGKQALEYSRIRYYGNNDFERTERQRTVIIKLLEKINLEGPSQFPSVLSNFLPYIETSLDKTEILNMGLKVMSFGLENIEQTRIPYDKHYTDVFGSVYYLDWEKDYTINELHNFIWGNKTP